MLEVVVWGCFYHQPESPFWPSRNNNGPNLPPKFNSSPLKNDGWKTTFLLGWYIFRGYIKLTGAIPNYFCMGYIMFVPGRVIMDWFFCEIQKKSRYHSGFHVVIHLLKQCSKSFSPLRNIHHTSLHHNASPRGLHRHHDMGWCHPAIVNPTTRVSRSSDSVKNQPISITKRGICGTTTR